MLVSRAAGEGKMDTSRMRTAGLTSCSGGPTLSSMIALHITMLLCAFFRVANSTF